MKRNGALKSRRMGSLVAACCLCAGGQRAPAASQDFVVTEPNLVFDSRQLGPSSRRSSLVITEIMYHPPGGRPLEFIEIHNTDPVPIDMSGYRLSGEVDFTFPSNMVLDATNYLVVAADPSALLATSPDLDPGHLFGPYSNALSNGGGTIRLRNRQDANLLEIDYDDDWPWPTQADGAGHSLVLACPDYGENDRRAWAASPWIGGSPMRPDFLLEDALSCVVINEILAHTDDPQADFVELYNRGTLTADISGCVIAESPGGRAYIVPPATLLAPGGHMAFDTNVLGFALSMSGDDLYLAAPGTNRIIDAVRYPAQVNGVSSGRYPDGHTEIRVLSSPTPANPNSAPLQQDVIINEIMYHPISGDSDDEYVELYNRGTEAVGVDHWRFTDGISFVFPEQTTIAPGGFLVVAKDATRLIAAYPQLNETNTLGDYSGSLSDRGERIVLSRPDDPALPEQDFVVIDTVHYSDGDDWGRWADGGGSSLELVDPRSDNRRAMNWAGSDETEKAPWTEIEYIGSTDYGKTHPTEIRAYLLQAGECLVDDVELAATNGIPYFAWSFESGQGTWQFWGNHSRSTYETGTGFGGGNCMHIRASGRGDNGNDQFTQSWPEAFWNRASAPLYQSPPDGQTLVARAKVRWLAGWQHGIVGVRGYWFEAPVTMELPTNLGSPGQTNSRVVPNQPPAISDVSHTPVLPAAREDVVVTCRAEDRDGVTDVTLTYRLDPSTEVTSTSMNDSGTGGDVLAGDGVYSATIPGQNSGQLVAFTVTATDGLVTNRYPQTEPEGAPERECLVRFGHTPPTGVLNSYHLWLTADNISRWRTIAGGNSKYSNEPIAMTLIYDGRRIAYNAGGRFRGLWRGGADNPESSGAYAISLFDSTRILGGTEIKIDQPGQNGADTSLQKENYCFWMAKQVGIPGSHIHFVHVSCNGGYRGIRHDLQTPALDFCESWFNDPAPQAFKGVGWTDDPFADYRDELGNRKKSHYRWNLRKRKSDPPSDDFSPVYKLADAFATADDETYIKRVRSVVDIRGWLSYFALNAAVSGWDSYGFSWCHNMYSYIPDRSGAFMFIYDMDHCIHGGTTGGLFPTDTGKWPVAVRFVNHPAVRREYWRFLKDLADGPFMAEPTNAWFDNWYAAFLAEGAAPASPDGFKTWIAGRRAHILAQLNAVASPFEIATNGGLDFTTPDPTVQLTGRAPIDAATVLVNGQAVDPVFTSVTQWRVDLPLTPGTNALAVEGLDAAGQPIASDAITITSTAPDVWPGSDLVINEIMYHADDPYGDFVEIHNLSPTQTYHLGGMRLNGLDYTFPYGTFIGPGGFIVVAENLPTYTKLHGNAEAVAGEYRGSLDNGGETLQLLAPLGTNSWAVLDEVRYDDAPPWPANADGTGFSLQLIDPTQDNTRIGNWATTPPLDDGRWQQVSLIFSTDPSSVGRDLHLFLDRAGELVVDDIELVELAAPSPAANLLTNGDFESELTPSWIPDGNHAHSAVTNAPTHAGSAGLRIVAGGAGDPEGRTPFTVHQDDIVLTPDTAYLLRYWCWLPAETCGLTAMLTGSSLDAHNVFHYTPPEPPLPATPGAPNNTAASLPPFPAIRINEVMPDNRAAHMDNANDYDPWIELHSAGTAPLDLGGSYYLSDDPGDLAKWSFPTGQTLQAGGYLTVYADGEPRETVSGFPHTDWRLNSTGGIVVLTRRYVDDLLVVDVFPYALTDRDTSIGLYPDGNTADRRVFHFPSPGEANSSTSRVTTVRINEWMAANTTFVTDPTDGKTDDWFEFFNYGHATANLGGYSLTDDLADTNRFVIPGGTLIPPGGHLLVWADKDTERNAPGQPLHVDFNLSKNGELIAFFAPDNSLADKVTFGPQPDNSSEGRWPDGAMAIHNMAPPTPGESNRVCIITALSAGAPENTMSWSAESGSVYTVSRRFCLTTGTWERIGNVTASMPFVTLTDTNLPSNGPQYYRVKRVKEQ